MRHGDVIELVEVGEPDLATIERMQRLKTYSVVGVVPIALGAAVGHLGFHRAGAGALVGAGISLAAVAVLATGALLGGGFWTMREGG